MPYLGNNLQVAFPSYTNIDDISGSFNGVLKTFPLNVSGSTPVPFPVNPQQCLISVNGVIQKPDSTGVSGFNLVGSNIVFASAPTGGWAFFGVVLAGADYVNVGAKFPSGSASVPSVTFESALTTGLYVAGANQLGIASNGVSRMVFGASGQVDLTGTLALTGAYNQAPVAVSALNIDCTLGNYFTKTISGNSTFTFSGTTSSRVFSFTLEVINVSGAITWPAAVKWPNNTAPTLSTGTTHLFLFVTDNNGSTWFGSSLPNYTV